MVAKFLFEIGSNFVQKGRTDYNTISLKVAGLQRTAIYRRADGEITWPVAVGRFMA